LFERSKSGAALTAAGEQFQKHALALVRVWQHAQLEVGLSGPYRDHLAVGAHATLWDGFPAQWISWLRDNIPDIAISASASVSAVMIQRLLEGTLDLAIMYRPGQPPGLTIEHLFDEEFVLVTSVPARSRRHPSNYVFVDWGPDFQAEHAAAFPELTSTGVNLDLGSLGLDYLLANEASGYFPAAAGQASTSTGAGCACRRGRASSATRSTWSIRRRATRKPSSRSWKGLRHAADRLA
jgi:DNA-binding transcriptional LysR family regulator